MKRQHGVTSCDSDLSRDRFDLEVKKHRDAYDRLFDEEYERLTKNPPDLLGGTPEQINVQMRLLTKERLKKKGHTRDFMGFDEWKRKERKKSRPERIIIDCDDSEEHVRKKSKPVIDDTTNPPIDTMNLLDIKRFLEDKLSGQDETLRRLAAVIYMFNKGNTKPILPLFLSGVSGTGKTKFVKLVKHLLAIKDTQYVYRDMTRMQKDEDIKILLGASPGTVGCDSPNTVPLDLLRAIGKSATSTDKRPSHYTIHTNNHPLPKTVLLHFDEADKAHENFFTLLNNFLETGILSTSSSVSFILPKETRLLVIFTANYGMDKIKEMNPDDHYDDACKVIRDEMIQYGVHGSFIGRLQYILPFFKLDAMTMKRLFKMRIKKVLDLDKNAFGQYYTSMAYDDYVIHTLMTTLNEKVDTGLGMRSIKNVVNNFKMSLTSEMTYRVLECSDTLPLSKESLRIRIETFTQSKHDDLLTTMKQHPSAFRPQTRNHIREKMIASSSITLLTVRNHNDLLTTMVVTTEKLCDKCDEYLTYQGISRVNDNEIIFHMKKICRYCQA